MSEYLIIRPDELYHYGVLGMKWGIRRYQNKNGKLTDEGRRRYATKTFMEATKKANKYEKKRSDAFVKGTATQAKAQNLLMNARKQKQIDKGMKLNKKAAKLLKASGRYEKKGRQWQKKMEKYFHGVSIKDVDKQTLEKGRKYVYLFIE